LKKPSPELLYLLAALRDGSVYYDKAARNYVVAFYQKNREWLEETLRPMITIAFHKKPMIDEYKPGHYRLRIYSKNVYDLIKRVYGFPEDHCGQAFWGVPEKLRSLNPEDLIPFIRGFFDAEGDVGLSEKSPYIGFSQKNREVLLFLKENLERLDIKTGDVHLIDLRSHTYRFVIASKEGLKRFIKLIGSLHPEKIVKLHRLGRILGQQT